MEELLKVSEKEKELVLKQFETDRKGVTRDVGILRQWFQQQQHLPQNVEGSDFFERNLVRNKCRVEQCKKQIDDYFTLKGVHKKYFDSVSNIDLSTSHYIFLPMPDLTPKQERLIIAKLRVSDTSSYRFKDFILQALSVCEMLMRYDYSVGVRILVDFEGVTLEHLLRIPPTVLSKFSAISMNGYKTRVTGLDFVNAPPYITILLALMKRILKDKVFKRIKHHDNFMSIHNEIPKHLLPKEFGGTQCSMYELIDKWDVAYKKHKAHFTDMTKYISNETLRPGGKKHISTIEVEDNFKNLCID